MKTSILRLLAIVLPTLWFGIDAAYSNTPLMNVLTCPVCNEDFKSTEIECPRCHFVWRIPFAKLTESDRLILERFVASEAYRTTIDRPRWERRVILYDQIGRPPREMIDACLEAALFTEDSAARNAYVRQALTVSETELAKLSAGPDKDRATLRVGDILRCLGRFDEARARFTELAVRKNPPFPDSTALQQELDLVEIKFRVFRGNDWIPATGLLRPTAVTAKNPSLGLPVHEAQITARPTGTYPLAIRYSGMTGEVTFAIAVDETGVVKKTKAIWMSQPAFVPDAEKFISACRFAPWIVDGKAQPFECAMAVEFQFFEP